MHIHLPWFMFLILGIGIAYLFFTRHSEQKKLERTDLKAEFRKRNKLK